MGKIRTKILGTEEELEQKRHDKARREGKKLQKKTKIPGLKGGERLVDMSTTAPETPPPQPEIEVSGERELTKKKKIIPKKFLGKNYRQAKTYVDRTKKYPIDKAIELAKKTSYTKFDGSVEVHINTAEKGIRGTVSLPHGTGKTIKVAIASDDLIKEIATGKINFDILISASEMMPKLAKVAKILGPKGLMPNPKAGTITADPSMLVKKLSSGQIQFKTEAEAPIIHSVIGKVSFANSKLEENFKALIEAVGKAKINSVFLNCTMGPGIKVLLEKGNE